MVNNTSGGGGGIISRLRIEPPNLVGPGMPHAARQSQMAEREPHSQIQAGVSCATRSGMHNKTTDGVVEL